MFTTVSKTAKLDMDNHEDAKFYEDILNNPLCTITAERVERTRTEDFSEETGRIVRSYEVLWRLVTWTEKVLIT